MARRRKGEKKRSKHQTWTEGTPRQPRKRRSLIRRVVAGTAKGTGRLIRRGGVAGVRAVRSRSAKQRFPEGYLPEPDEVPGKAWYPGSGGGQCTACHKRFGSDAGLRRHFEIRHADENPDPKNFGRYHGAALDFKKNRAAKKAVRKTTRPSARRATTAGGRTMGRKARDVEVDELMLLRQAFEAIGEMGTGPVSKMEAFANGLDIVFGKYGAEAFQNYRLSLIHKEFPPEVLTGLIKIEELFREIAQESTKWIDHLLKVLAEDIEAAKRLRKSGPSVGTLAG